MRKTAFSISLLTAFLFLCTSAMPAPMPYVSFAEKPVRLLRNTDFYLGTRGSQLQSGDIIDSGPAALMLNCGSDCAIGLGPASQVQMNFGPNKIELILLHGWLKIQSRAPASSQSVILRYVDSQVDASGCSIILHGSSSTAEVFVEAGEPTVEEFEGGGALRRFKLKSEQYVFHKTGEPLRLPSNPPREFIRSLPPVFMDALPRGSLQGAPRPFKLEHAAALADIDPWLADDPALRKIIERRFQPSKKATTSVTKPATRPEPVHGITFRDQELARIRKEAQAAASGSAAEAKPASEPDHPSSPTVEH